MTSAGLRTHGVSVTDVYDDPDVADIYDHTYGWALDDDFYLSYIENAERVLDIGCGTGRTLRGAWERGWRGRGTGIDPATAMLERARRADQFDWHVGTAPDFDWAEEFDLAFMTGHAFQYLQTDDEILANLQAVRRFLRPGGVFVFETRNPLVRGWEDWPQRYSGTTTNARGEVVTSVQSIEKVVDDRWVSSVSVSESPSWTTPVVHRETLRFITKEELDGFFDEAGLRLVEQYGDWDRGPFTPTSKEIISVVKRA